MLVNAAAQTASSIFIRLISNNKVVQVFALNNHSLRPRDKRALDPCVDKDGFLGLGFKGVCRNDGLSASSTPRPPRLKL